MDETVFASLASAWLDLWNGNLDRLDAIVAEDAVIHAVVPGEARVGERRGRRALGDWIRQTHEFFDERTEYEVGPIVQPPHIVVRWRSRGTYNGGMPDVDAAAKGARIDFTGIDILRVEEGRIAEFWMSADTDVLMGQLEAAAGG